MKPPPSDPLPPESLLDPDTIDRLRRLEMRARSTVDGFMTGRHRSPYNGFAVEFATHRSYSPGDDLRHIDWKVWSKTDRLYVKEYEEETNLQCTLLVDCSRSMRYGAAAGDSKYDHAAAAAASLAYLLARQQDAVGLATFHREVVLHLPPSAHPAHFKQLLHALATTRPDERTDVADVFARLARQVPRRGVVALISDLLMPLDDFARAVAQFRLRRHELIVFQVLHSDELRFPFEDLTLFQGLETDGRLQTEPRALRKSYLEALERHLAGVRKTCAAAGVDHLLLDTSQSLEAALAGYLHFRQRARRR